MAKFEIIQDCSVEGTNITPYGSEVPNFHLTYHFHERDVVEAVDEQEQFIEVETNGGTFDDGTPYQGACRFFIPKEYVRLIDESEPIPAPPPEEGIAPVTQSPLDIYVMNGDLIPEASVPKTYSENVTSSIKVDYQPDVKEKKETPNDGLKLGGFIVVLFVAIIIWMFLANC